MKLGKNQCRGKKLKKKESSNREIRDEEERVVSAFHDRKSCSASSMQKSSGVHFLFVVEAGAKIKLENGIETLKKINSGGKSETIVRAVEYFLEMTMIVKKICLKKNWENK